MLGSPYAAMGLPGLNGLTAAQFGAITAGIPGLGLPGMPGMPGMHPGAISPYSPYQAAAAALAAQQTAQGLRMPGLGGPPGAGTVLLVSNLNENTIEPDHLFMLFGVYGDVQRVKILFNKKDTALIQMSEPQGALQCISNLDKVGFIECISENAIMKNAIMFLKLMFVFI